MKWINEPWRKLYTRITGEWLQLSVMARGLADELLKYAKDDGSICDTKGADPGLCVALLLSAKPHELAAVQSAVPELLEDKFLVFDGTRILIRNLKEAQERKSAAARRQQKYRDSLSEEEEDDEDETVTRDVTVTPDVTPKVTTVCDAERKKERKKERLSSAFDFEPLYERYPNKQGKAKGIAKLKALVKTEAEFQAVLRGLECFIRDEKRKGTETRFYPHFSTWVNGKRWEDYPAPAASEAVKGAEAHPAERRLTALEQIKLDEARERGLIP